MEKSFYVINIDMIDAEVVLHFRPGPQYSGVRNNDNPGRNYN